MVAAQNTNTDSVRARRQASLRIQTPHHKRGEPLQQFAQVEVTCNPYLADQTVPAGLLMGTPTALPYSVHEPS